MSKNETTSDEELGTVGHPDKLQRGDDTTGFQSGVDELDEWLNRYAWINQKANNAVTYVTTTKEKRVVGYYAIAVSGVSKDLVPPDVAGDSPPTAVPCILLARLAVDWQYQGKGIGSALFKSALQRAIILSESVGIRAFLIHARDDAAREFYLHIADLQPSPTDPLHLMISINEVKEQIGDILTD